MATALVHQNVLVFHDHDQCYQAIQSRDARFDGYFVTAVRTTGIYCRPSCPARTPLRSNVEFFSTGGAAQQHGYRACKRCRPELAPDSPEWNLRSDLVGRAMRLISEGEVDRGGVGPLAARLGYSSRQLQRVVRSELGASAAVLARARRAEAARGGGFAAAMLRLGGEARPLYHRDATKPDRPRARTLTEEIGRVVRARAANPVWADGMMGHGFRGAAEIAATLDHMASFANLTLALPPHLFDLYHDATLGRDDIVSFMERENPAALQAMRDKFAALRDAGLWITRRNSIAAAMQAGER